MVNFSTSKYHKGSVYELCFSLQRANERRGEKLLHVSDATATRYLAELEK